MDVRVRIEGLAPGVQGHDDAGYGPEVARVRQHVHQFFFGRPEQQVAHRLHVQPPQVVEVVGNGEDGVVVVAIQQARFLFLQPAGGLQERTLRAGAVLTGVVPDLGLVAVGTDLFVTTQDGGAAAGHFVNGVPDMLLQGMGALVSGIVLAQDRLNGRRLHTDHCRPVCVYSTVLNRARVFLVF